MWRKYIIALTIASCTATELAARKPAGEIRIRIYDYVPVDEQTLQNAQKEASRLLRPAGVQVVWLNCQILLEDRPANHPCSAPLTATDIHLRIYDRTMAGRVRTRAGCVGVSLVSEGFDTIGAVFYHRALELKGQLGISLASILAAVIAHEVGHLLLEETRHAKSGLMSAHWDYPALRRISHGQLGFAAADRERIAIQLAQRIASDQRIDSPNLSAGLFF